MRGLFVWLLLVAALFGVFSFFGVGDDHLHHAELLKVSIVAAAFTAACYFDSRRGNPELRVSRFLREVGAALLLALPLLPFLAVLFRHSGTGAATLEQAHHGLQLVERLLGKATAY